MIDISQWRATIELWYYQICDNVIDESLPELCRKGTRAKKQFSKEKHSQTNWNSTAVNGLVAMRYHSPDIPILRHQYHYPMDRNHLMARHLVILSNISTANTTMRYVLIGVLEHKLFLL